MEVPSPFSSYLGTNYAATNEEMDSLSKLLAEPLSKLDVLKQEIHEAEARYDSLVNQYNALAQDIEQHRALMAPIRHLPVDILQEIFLHCLPDTHNAVISTSRCPMLLTRICSGWRRIALDTASLWASIHIPIPTDAVTGMYSPTSWSTPLPTSLHFPTAKETAMRRARAITEWLGRSGGCVLDISLYDREHNTSLEIYDIILDALIPFCEKWGSLVCETPARSLRRITTIPESSLPNLHTLTICGSSPHGVFPPSPYPSQATITFWSNSGALKAPRLRSISYNNITEDFTRFPLNWRQLTSITLHGITWHASEAMSVERMAVLLSTCPSLRSCSIEIASPRHVHEHLQDPDALSLPSVAPPAVISLKHLTYLSIHAGRVHLSVLLEALEVPVLERLEFQTSLFTAAPLISLLHRCSDSLRALTVDSSFFTREEFFACLAASVHLVELTLRRNYYTPQQAWTPPPYHGGWGTLPDPDTAVRTHLVLDDAFMGRMLAVAPGAAAGEDDTVLLPCLRKFSCHNGAQFSDAGVLEAVKARNAAAAASAGRVAKLELVNISFARPQQLPLRAEVDAFEQDGVECRLAYSPPSQASKHLPTDGIPDLMLSTPWGAPIY